MDLFIVCLQKSELNQFEKKKKILDWLKQNLNMQANLCKFILITLISCMDRYVLIYVCVIVIQECKIIHCRLN